MSKKLWWWMGIAACVVGCQNSQPARQPLQPVSVGNSVRPAVPGNTVPGYSPTANPAGWNNRSTLPTANPPGTNIQPGAAYPNANPARYPNTPAPSSYGNPTPVQIQQSRYNLNGPSAPLPSSPQDARHAPGLPPASPASGATPAGEFPPKPEPPAPPAGMNNANAPASSNTTVRTTLPSAAPNPQSRPTSQPSEPMFPTLPPNPPIP
ncbi:hypothetical protein HRbin36_00495 [bacterium HR36]|nr:hypothetical protein HRbin36_00495 [bacterium HR36]